MCSSVIGILSILVDGIDPLGWAYWSRLAGDMEKKYQMTLAVGAAGLPVGTLERWITGWKFQGRGWYSARPGLVAFLEASTEHE